MASLERSQPSRGVARVLAQVLEQPNLVEEVRALAPQDLARVVETIGLEDAGELLALVSTDQLVGLFDEALWKNRQAGEVETFDPAEFARWLGVLFEAGEAWVAERLAALPEDLLTLAIGSQIWVFDADGFTDTLAQEDPEVLDRVEKQLASSLSEELWGYELIARRPDSWDLVIAALTELDREHSALQGRVLARLASLSAQQAEDAGGLSELLSGEESLADEVAGTREERRGAEGFVPAADALAYLRLAARGVSAPARDPITAAYFRRLDGTRAPVATLASHADLDAPPSPLSQLLARAHAEADDGASASVDARGAQRALPGATESPLRAAMRSLDADTLAARQSELAYLANVLVAGATIGARRVRPVEAVRAAIAIVEHGMSIAPRDANPSTLTLDALFRLGWAELRAAAVRAGSLVTAENDLSILLEPGSQPRR